MTIGRGRYGVMHSRKTTIFAFAATMALAGFLLFQVQPLLGKYILPWFGGSASTWIVCLLFFQTALLAGYAHAYAITRPLTVPRQAQVQLAILAGSLLLLPITPAESWKPQDAGNPTWRIIALLALSAGVPYAALATTTPLLSRWLARIEPGLDPARFFAASNLGSFAGILSYPFVFEPLMSSEQQTRWWSWAYALYAVLFAFCGFLALRCAKGDTTGDGRAPSTTADGREPVLMWIGFAALGSTLLLATTNAITQWSAVVPFLWVLPLSVYLLTFVLAFGYPRLYARAPFAVAFLLLAAATFVVAHPDSAAALLGQLVLHAATLFVGCMICHAELARLQPAPQNLPTFYLGVAAGGALGGVLVALAAPLAFNDYVEHPLVLCAIAATALALVLRTARAERAGWAVAAATLVGGIAFAVGLASSVAREVAGERTLVERLRNFYGVVKVVREEEGNPRRHSLTLVQAGVEQGAQFQGPERRTQLVCGYNEASGVGLAMAHHARRRRAEPLSVGVVGLGVGMTAALGREGDRIRYYELNPAVLEVANRHFTFLRSGKARTQVALGDGRLLLERELEQNGSQAFDVLVLNAFRGASPPMHLMTKEAFDIYLGHLAADGILAVNFELDTFEMAPLHRGMARRFGIDVRWFETREYAGCDGAISWALYTRDKSFFEVPAVKRAISPWRDRGRSELVWTDRDSNLMSIVNWRGE